MWTKEVVDYLKQTCSFMTDTQIAIELTRITGKTVSVISVKCKRIRLNIAKAQGRGICKIVSGSTSTSTSDSETKTKTKTETGSKNSYGDGLGMTKPC